MDAARLLVAVVGEDPGDGEERHGDGQQQQRDPQVAQRRLGGTTSLRHDGVERVVHEGAVG